MVGFVKSKVARVQQTLLNVSSTTVASWRFLERLSQEHPWKVVCELKEDRRGMNLDFSKY